MGYAKALLIFFLILYCFSKYSAILSNDVSKVPLHSPASMVLISIKGKCPLV